MPHHRPALLIFSAVLIVILGCAGVPAADFADCFKAGLDAEDAGNLDDALKYYSEAVKIFPSSARALAKRAEVYLKRGDPQAAIKDHLNIAESKTLVVSVALGFPDRAAAVNEFRSPRVGLEEFVRWVD